MVALNYFLGIGSECPSMLFGKMSETLLSPLENNNGHSDYIHCTDSTFIYVCLRTVSDPCCVLAPMALLLQQLCPPSLCRWLHRKTSLRNPFTIHNISPKSSLWPAVILSFSPVLTPISLFIGSFRDLGSANCPLLWQ